ncbi:MAG: putative dynein heavy chain, partial [Streblomastix strix]
EGVDKLINASTEVDTMNEKLREQKKVTDEQSRQCDDLVKQIEMNTQDVKKKSDDVEKRKKYLWVEQEKIVVDKQDAENVLALTAPALEATAQALRFLEDNKDSINETRVYNTPPKVVQQVFECVSILLEEKDLTWDTIRTMLHQTGFLDLLMNFNKEKLLKKELIMARVIPRLQGQNPAEIKQQHSKAADFIMEWVVAMYQWYDKAKFVQPKKERVEAAEVKLRQSMADLQKAENEIVALNNELKLLDEALQQKRKEQAELKAQLTIIERQLNNARILIVALSI